MGNFDLRRIMPEEKKALDPVVFLSSAQGKGYTSGTSTFSKRPVWAGLSVESVCLQSGSCRL